jgi:long-chain acyl-CoA synthetase
MIVDPETGAGPLPPGQVGELVVRGPQVMAGYWNDPEATAAVLRDGWLLTGDLGTCDADGFFRIVDRKKDLIITSGVNVYPTDVEHVLRQFEGVEDIAVLGVPDAERGELVKAIVVPKPGKPFDRKAFREFASQHLEVHKRPRVVEVIPGPLPRNALGKVLRRVLRDMKGGEHVHDDAAPVPNPA